jgi:hypothetical protein
MPAPSVAARRAWAIAEHNPEELYDRNKGMLKATHQQQHDFASTKEKDLPQHVHKNPLSFRSYRDGGVVPNYACGGIVIPLKVK